MHVSVHRMYLFAAVCQQQNAVLLPFTFQENRRTVEDGQRDLVDPAVKGTKNVLSAVAKSLDSVKRVVLTSSFAGKF